MHDRDLSALLTKLNTGRGSQTIVKIPLHPSIDFAKVWTNPVRPNQPHSHIGQPFTFYFVKDDSSNYTCCVYDAIGDLHWYTARKHRRKGLLKNALSAVIIPHILGRRDEISITIQTHDESSRRSSTQLASKLGFVLQSDDSWRYEARTPHLYVTPELQSLTAEEIDMLQNRMHYAKDFIRITVESLRLRYGDVRRVNELHELSTSVAHVTDNLVDSIRFGFLEELDS